MPPAIHTSESGDVVQPPVDQNTSTKILDPPDPQNEPQHGNPPEGPGIAPKSRRNTNDYDPSQEQQDRDQETLEVPPGETGGTPSAPGLERKKLQPPLASEWAGPHNKAGPRSELHSSDIQEGYVDVNEFDNDIDASDASRQPLPRHPKDTVSSSGHGHGDRSGDPNDCAATHNRNPRDTGSNLGHGEGDRSRDPGYAAAAAAHSRNLKRPGQGQINVQGTRYGEGPDRRELPGAYHDQGFEDSRQQGIAGYTLGGIASSIQAAIIPTPQQKIQQLKDELRSTQSQLAEARGHLDAYIRELKRTRGENRQMGHHINGLDHERLRLKEANQSYENELVIVRRELDDAKNLALIRGKELVGAQVFLTKADALSISEVVEKVNNLNEEVFQAAALLGEVLIHKPHEVTQEQMTYALGISQGIIGSPIINVLREQSLKEVPEANPLIVQVVLQVFLVSYCSQMVQSWSSDAGAASYLAAVYSRIRDKEEQAVSGRWRALTRSHTRPTPEGWKEDLLRKLGSVLRVASWMTPTAQQRDAFEQKLEPIFRAVADLRNALGEKFTSADLEVSIMEVDQVFQPAYMDDAYGDPDRKPAGKHAPPEVVIGTTGIGLKKAMLKRSAKGEVTYENVLSAKVALQSTILEALNPPPPRNSRKKKITKPFEKDELPPPPKHVTGTGTHKSSSSTSTAAAVRGSREPAAAAAHTFQQATAAAHASQQAAAAAHPSQQSAPATHSSQEAAGPPQPPKTSQTSAKSVQRRGTLPESPEGTAGAASASGQPRKPGQRPPLAGSPEPQEGDAGANAGPHQSGQQRDGQNPQSRTKEKLKDDGGIEGALAMVQMGALR